MDVKQLSDNQLNSLKQKIYYMNEEELEEEFKEVLNDDIIIELEKINYFFDISNEIIYELFSGFYFVFDDFGFE